jgi:D-alanyl-D-alanine carboxypeptidase
LVQTKTGSQYCISIHIIHSFIHSFSHSNTKTTNMKAFTSLPFASPLVLAIAVLAMIATVVTAQLPVGNIYADSSTVACAAGTTNLGVFTGYTGGTALQVRLCAIPGLSSGSSESTPGTAYYIAGASGLAIVNSRVSGAMLGLVNAARASGRTLSANSSFRTNQHQTDLCNANTNCRNGIYDQVARPGTSNHQLGVAIDFAGTSVRGGSTCATRARDTASAVWNWLEANARRFGFRQYSAESWHWDATTTSNRC